jgi:predicted RNA-binding protein YlqC (UPF0109 family)
VTEMKQFIEFVARSVVDHPNEVSVSEVQGEGDQTLVLELRCNKEDAGKIIGRGGRTIKALRTLLVTAGAKQGVRAVLELVE